MVNKQRKRRRITQSGKKLCHPRRALDLKAKDLIGPDQTILFSSQLKATILGV
mgnify:CR=1 FL=1